MAPAGAGESRHALVHRAGLDAEIAGDGRDLRRTAHGAARSNHFARDQFFREIAAAGETAGAAIALGQQPVDFLDAGVLVDEQFSVRQGQHQREKAAEAGHEDAGHADDAQLP